MRRVFGIGEIVYDIIFKDGQPASAKAGGSVLNALISLARMGHECYMISELGDDLAGKTILSFLKENKLNTQYIQQYTKGQSAIALAFLNEQNDAEYNFYKNYPEDRLNQALPDFQEGDIFLFGSTYTIAPEIRSQVLKFAEHAAQSGCIVLYDPNFRKVHDQNKDMYLSYMQENFNLADIVRGSNEDFENIHKASNSENAYLNIQDQCQNLVYTANAHGVFVQTPLVKKHYAVPQIKTVSTIGAGDNFNAGIIHGLLQQNHIKKDLETLNESQWDYLIDCGIQFSSAVCQSYDNYVDTGFSL